MPVKHRLPKQQRRAFSDEALALFVRLEQSQCGGWEEGSRQLAGMLNLTDEWWTGNSVLNRSETPCHPEGYAAYTDWHTCREVREALLVAVEGGGVLPKL